MRSIESILSLVFLELDEIRLRTVIIYSTVHVINKKCLKLKFAHIQPDLYRVKYYTI